MLLIITLIQDVIHFHGYSITLFARPFKRMKMLWNNLYFLVENHLLAHYEQT
jgi:hypothetical protein